MNLKLTTLIPLIVTTLFSCQSSKIKKEAEEKTKEFLTVFKTGDEKNITTLYQGFKNFDAYSKSDSAKINSSVYNDGIVSVSVHNRFTNGYGKIFERDLNLYFKKDSTGKLILFDSKGLTDFSEKNNYKFGIKTGCINKSTDTTDQAILKALKKSKMVLMDKGIEVYLELKRDIHVVTWNWEAGYGGSASGKGIVKNDSHFDIPELKYKITYKDNAGNEITSDKGTISYDKIEVGGSRSFTFYTSYIGNATRANINLDFDEELIFNYLTDKEWTGKECNEYFTKNPDKLKIL